MTNPLKGGIIVNVAENNTDTTKNNSETIMRIVAIIKTIQNVENNELKKLKKVLDKRKRL